MRYFSRLSHSSMASAIALPKAPFFPPYLWATLARKSRSSSSGSSIVIRPMLKRQCGPMSIRLNNASLIRMSVCISTQEVW